MSSETDQSFTNDNVNIRDVNCLLITSIFKLIKLNFLLPFKCLCLVTYVIILFSFMPCSTLQDPYIPGKCICFIIYLVIFFFFFFFPPKKYVVFKLANAKFHVACIFLNCDIQFNKRWRTISFYTNSWSNILYFVVPAWFDFMVLKIWGVNPVNVDWISHVNKVYCVSCIITVNGECVTSSSNLALMCPLPKNSENA